MSMPLAAASPQAALPEPVQDFVDAKDHSRDHHQQGDPADYDCAASVLFGHPSSSTDPR